MKRLYSLRLDAELIEFLKSLPNASEKIRELIKLMRDIEMKEFDKGKAEAEITELGKEIKKLEERIMIAESILDEGLEAVELEDGRFKATAKDHWDWTKDGYFHIAIEDDERTALRKGIQKVKGDLREWKARRKELSTRKERLLFRLKAAEALKE